MAKEKGCSLLRVLAEGKSDDWHRSMKLGNEKEEDTQGPPESKGPGRGV